MKFIDISLLESYLYASISLGAIVKIGNILLYDTIISNSLKEYSWTFGAEEYSNILNKQKSGK